MAFQGTQTLGATGIATMTGLTAGNGLLIPGSGDVLTISPGVTVQGNSGFVGSTTGGFVNNQGTIIANGGEHLPCKATPTFRAAP